MSPASRLASNSVITPLSFACVKNIGVRPKNHRPLDGKQLTLLPESLFSMAELVSCNLVFLALLDFAEDNWRMYVSDWCLVTPHSRMFHTHNVYQHHGEREALKNTTYTHRE